MATYTATSHFHSTLTAGVADTVTMTAIAGTAVEVVNRTGSAEIYWCADGTAASVGAQNCRVLVAGICADDVTLNLVPGVELLPSGNGVGYVPSGDIVVSLISTAAQSYSIQGQN